ncbi:MAG: hypothetical protein ACRBN8_17955 [Nannocystales bacterium]
MNIDFVRWDQAARLYAVLARLDLGADAASLYDARLATGPWVESLLDAYQAAPKRLLLHGAPLVLSEEGRPLEVDIPPAGLSDASGRRLWAATLEGLEAIASEPLQYAEVPAEIIEPLGVLRAALWERVGPPPPLTVVDCPALRRAGRAVQSTHGRLVGVSLAEPAEHLLCQVLHEETHALTDPVVRQAWSAAGAGRDTSVGSPGYARHQALEAAAVEVGDALIAARAPQWSDAYRRWRARFGK